MRVQIKQPSGYRDRNGVDHRAGDVIDMPDHIAVKLIGYGIASAAREAPVERVVKAAPKESTAAKTPSKSTPRKGTS